MKAIYKLGEAYIDMRNISTVESKVISVDSSDAHAMINQSKVRFKLFKNEPQYKRHDKLSGLTISMMFRRENNKPEYEEYCDECRSIRTVFLDNAQKELDMFIQHWISYVEYQSQEPKAYVRDH